MSLPPQLGIVEEGAPSPGAVPSSSINLRDLAWLTDAVRPGVVYRSSQVVSPAQLRSLGIRAVVDLRQAPVACKERNLLHSLSATTVSLWAWLARTLRRKCSRRRRRPDASSSSSPDRRALLSEEPSYQPSACDSDRPAFVPPQHIQTMGPAPAPTPAPCWRCTSTGEAAYGVKAAVYHVDLLPGTVTLRVFAALPHRLQAKVVYLKLTRKHPEPVVAAAVADPRIVGYLKLYKIVLTRAGAQLAAALRVLLCDGSTPALIHCIHGKDRTGLVVMLLYLLAGVPRDKIVEDYARSESLLREGRDNRQLLGLPEELATDGIIAAAAHVMEDTIDFLCEKWGGVREYLAAAGMTAGEVEAVRAKIMADGLVDGDSNGLVVEVVR